MGNGSERDLCFESFRGLDVKWSVHALDMLCVTGIVRAGEGEAAFMVPVPSRAPRPRGKGHPCTHTRRAESYLK